MTERQKNITIEELITDPKLAVGLVKVFHANQIASQIVNCDSENLTLREEGALIAEAIVKGKSD